MALDRGALGARGQSRVKREYCFTASVLRGEGASIPNLQRTSLRIWELLPGDIDAR